LKIARAGSNLNFTYYLGPRLYFRPHIQFSSITDRRLRGQLASANIVIFGLAFGFTSQD